MAGNIQLSVLNETEVKEIHLATLEVLEKTGVKVVSKEGVELLRDAGCNVSGDNIVKIPPHVVGEAIATAPESFLLYDRNGEHPMRIGGGRVTWGTGVTNTNFRDINTGERRDTVTQDIRNAALLCDYLPNYDWIMPLGTVQDVRAPANDVFEFEAAVTSTTKPIVFIVNDIRGLEDVINMASIIAGGRDELIEKPFIISYPEPASPLFHVPEAVEKLLYSAELGLPIVYTPCPMAGATAPVTMAGLLTTANAECLSGLVMAQLKRPGVPFVVGGVLTILDMARGAISYGAPEMSLLLAGYADIARFYGLPTWGTAGCSDSKLPDEQAAIESTFSCMANALSGYSLVHDPGFLEAALVGSLELLVMTDEIIGMVKRFTRGIDVNDATIARDVIGRVGPAGYFLDQEHTRDFYRSEHWRPSLMDRTPYEQWSRSGSKTMGQRAREKALEVLRTHRPQPLEAAKLKAIRKVRDLSLKDRVG